MNTDKVKEITDKLEEGLLNLKNSDDFKKYLTCMSKFHSYSFNNTLLIMMQCPQATYVAGFNSWKNNFNRVVKKGEKGIKILAPSPIKKMVETEKVDSNGKKYMQEEEMIIPCFKPVTVFDVSQTDGDPIPELKGEELADSVLYYEDMKKALSEVSKVPIREDDIKDGAKGYFSPTEKEIVINKGMGEAQTIKTLVHEIAHSILHDFNKETPLDDRKDRNTKEVEAESVAFTVCKHFGIDTDDYSFGYILGWSKDATLNEFKQSLQTIQKTASQLIGRIESELINIEKAKDKGLHNKLVQAKEKVDKQTKNQTERRVKSHEASLV